MTTSPSISTRSRPARPRAALARTLVLRRLADLQHGRLTIEDGQGSIVLGDAQASDELVAHVRVHDEVLWRDVLLHGVLGAGEAYASGAWSTDDLPTVVRVLLRNRPMLQRMDGGLARVSRPMLQLLYAMRRNTRSGSRANIAAHYDLGNDFFAQFLDETMTYSAGIFEHEDATLAEASTAKYRALSTQLDLGPDHHVLEIGCGWGGFALHAARTYGCRVTAATISQAQHSYATERVREAGLEDLVQVLLCDYRDLRGTYDRIVSIEMIEAVGHQYLDTFLRTCSARLKPGGRMGLQAITISDAHYEGARRRVDFIKRYIFPGSFIPSVNAISGSLARTTDMRIVHLRDIGLHYAETLQRWRERFLRNAQAVRTQGFSETFLRLWDYYFAYCEAGFRERVLSNVQIVLERPRIA